MKLLLSAVLAGLLCCTHAVNQSDGFTDDQYSECFNGQPSKTIRGKFVDGTIIDDSNKGQTLSGAATASEPTLEFFRRYDRLYTALMFCVDQEGCAKSVPILWLTINISNGDAKQGELQKRYTPPTPSLTQSLRCVIAVLEQSRKITGTASALDTSIIGQLLNKPQNVNDLVKKLDLTISSAITFRTQKVL